MKKYLLALVVGLLSQATMAADLYCGANIEEIPGSQIFNKLIFWDKTDTTKPNLRFLLADGTLIKSEEFTPSVMEKIVDGTLAMSISFNETRPTLFLGKVKRNEKNEIAFIDTVLSSSLKGNGTSSGIMLIAHGATLSCLEL